MRVTFAELSEVESTFGRELIAVAGGSFDKYLVYFYDLDAKTIIFPIGWMLRLREGGGTMEFRFIRYCQTILRRDLIREVDFVEVADYDPREFQPNRKLALMTLRIPRRNKNRVDKLIQEYRMAGIIFAERSREGSMVIEKPGKKERVFPQYLYEIMIKKSAARDFVEQLYEQNLVYKKKRFMIMTTSPVFPRQLAYFKDSK